MTTWRDRRRWRKDLRDVPLDRFREMVRRSHFYATPGKQRWAERWLWRREHALALIGTIIAAIAAVIAAIGLYLKG